MRFTLVLLVLASAKIFGQDYSAFKNSLREINQISLMSDSVSRQKSIDLWWAALKEKNQIPLVVEDSVAFLYQGKARSVTWAGDFNGWGFDKTFYNDGHKIGNSKVWLLKASFPKDARLDYKIILDRNNYILDPSNPYQQWSGVGGGSPNSELRMPLWKESAEQITHNDIPHGKIISDVLMNSIALGYQITYSVYLPYGFEKMGKLPSLYVTDGYEYLHPKMGNMSTVLDNLIAEKKIKPIIVVFVDHREPVNRSNNRRMQELAMNSLYLDFFVKELIPEIEKNYPTVQQSTARGIMGTSMGGLTSTYFAFARPDVFGLAGIQSPAFWTKPQIYQLCSSSSNTKMKISMTSGAINDTNKEAEKMKNILAASSCEYNFHQVNEGHSWGNWRNLIDDVLIDLFGI